MSPKRVGTHLGRIPRWDIPVGERGYPLTPQFVAEWLNNGGLPHPRSRWDDSRVTEQWVCALKENPEAVRWLNEHPGIWTPGYYRITNLISAFREAAQVYSGLAKALKKVEGDKSDLIVACTFEDADPDVVSDWLETDDKEEIQEARIRLRAPLGDINRLLKHYTLTPSCSMAYADLRRWHIEWIPPFRSGPRHPLDDHTRISDGEITVLQQILRMAAEGTLDYLAWCNCGRWYVRRKLDQLFHSQECRTHSPMFKEHRRKYWKVYYESNFKKDKPHAKRR